MIKELRVVHPVLSNQPMVVRDREVWLDETGTTSPLTPEEHEYLTSIPGFLCASQHNYERDHRKPAPLVPLTDAELGRIKAAGFRLVPIGEPDLPDDPFYSTGVGYPNPPPEDLAEPEEEFQDLFDAWLTMDEAERCATVGDLEDNGAGETLLVALFDHEANLLNNPKVIAAIDTAIGHLRPARSTGQIAQDLVKNSAAGKINTKNPPHPKRGK